MEGWTDRLTNGQMAFQFYIVQDAIKKFKLKKEVRIAIKIKETSSYPVRNS